MEPHQSDPALLVARTALAAAPAGLLSDLDGTLAPIVAEPGSARVLPGAADALAALAGAGTVVGVISGRSALDARRILGRDDILVVGNHGLEWLEPGSTTPDPDPAAVNARSTIERALAAVPAEAGVEVEHKGLSATVHVRRAADPAAAAARAREALTRAAVPGVDVRGGRMSIELRPAGAGDKGTAVGEVARRYRLRGMVVIGDDVTDLDMFHAARRLHRDEGVSVAVLAVGGAGEAPPEVAAAADAVLPDPAAVVRMLRDLAAS
jgi:trehalose 6-phosphate phosphatase